MTTHTTPPDAGEQARPPSRAMGPPWPGLALNLAATAGAGALALATRGRGGRGAAVTRGLAVFGAGATWAYLLAIRPWHLRWGATDEEVQRPMPGDDEPVSAHLDATRAITVDAPPEAVWPWLVQMGQGRAGFYTFAWIENLGGMDIHNADRIAPEWQRLQVGDLMPTGPDEGFRVAALEPNRSMLLLVPYPHPQVSIALRLDPLEGQRTRLVARLRVQFPRTGLWPLYELLFDPGDFVMMWGMLRGIRRRAERARASRGVWEPTPASAPTGADVPR